MAPTSGSGGLQLVPFRDLRAVLTGDDSIVQVVGNLLVFAALGFFLPIRFRLARPAWVPGIVGLVAGGLSVLVEAIQLTLPLGRVASVDDVLLNAAGAAIASLASARYWRSRTNPDPELPEGLGSDPPQPVRK
ncbi:VanZ family protein [Agromyces silvae]|uniref:VanZ family protein n=1 Tax=Agromyces silvae TaxID=3388266 RepID=UPI00280AD9F4|nr:VanZ family protein [Agromyces protaetiae]